MNHFSTPPRLPTAYLVLHKGNVSSIKNVLVMKIQTLLTIGAALLLNLQVFATPSATSAPGREPGGPPAAAMPPQIGDHPFHNLDDSPPAEAPHTAGQMDTSRSKHPHLHKKASGKPLLEWPIEDKNKASSLALIFGILAIVFTLAFFPAGFVFGVLAIIFGTKARRKGGTTKELDRAVTGRTLGVVSVVISAFVGLIAAALIWGT